MAKFLFFANSTTDAAAIRADRVTDIEIYDEGSTVAGVKVHFLHNDNTAGSVILDTTSNTATLTAAREIARICAQKDGRFITIADDVNSIYVDGVEACGTIAHSD